jgi:hypothetical protein
MAYVFQVGDGVENFPESKTKLGKVLKSGLVGMVLALQTEIRILQDDDDEDLWENGRQQGKEDCEEEIDALKAENTRLNSIIQEGTEDWYQDTPLFILDMMDRCSKAEAKLEEYKQAMCDEVDAWKTKFQSAVTDCREGSDITDHCEQLINHLHNYCEIDRITQASETTEYGISGFYSFESEVKAVAEEKDEVEELAHHLKRDLDTIGGKLGLVGDNNLGDYLKAIEGMKTKQKKPRKKK